MYKNKNRALTLIEFMACVGILTVTLFLGAVFIKFHQPGLQLSASARELRGSIERTRDYSLTKQTPFAVKFLIVNNQYQIIRASDQAVLETITLPSKVQFYSVGPFSNDVVSFNSAGGASEAGAVVIQNSDNQQKQIIISPAGYVRIE